MFDQTVINILKIIYKDISFNIRQALLGVLGSAIVICLMVLDETKFSTFTFFMVPMFMFSFAVGRMCYMEDKDNVYMSLKALPINKKHIVLSKYIESFIIVILSYVLIYLANFVLGLFGIKYYSFNISLISFLAGILIIYFSIYLLIFFKYNFSSAQQTLTIIFIGFLGIFKGYEYLKNSTNLASKSIEENLPYILFATSIIVYCFAYKMAAKCFIAKE